MLKRALLSEKSMKLAKEGVFTFIVDRMARKIEIARLVENQFGVKVLSVKTIARGSETKVQRSRKGRFTMPGYKKALVQLKDGQKIDLFELESAQTEKSKETEVKEKKSLLKGTKVKIEKGEK